MIGGFFMRELTIEEIKTLKGGELTVAAVLAVMVAAVVAVIIYRLFMSSSGSTTLPGGFKFEWEYRI